MGPPAEDDDLIARAGAGDSAAFEELVRRYQDLAFQAAFLIANDAGEAEDATQEAFLKAYRFLHRFRPGSPFRPWLLKIVVNEALTLAKRRRRRAEVGARLARMQPAGNESMGDMDNTVADSERARALREAIEALREQERVLIYLRYFLSLPEKDIAAYLGCAPGTVKSRLHRALLALRRVIARSYPELTGELA